MNKTIKNSQDDWINHYKDSLDDYIKFRIEKNVDISQEEAAYNIFENFGLLFRYTNEEKYLKRLNKLILEDKFLLEDAINYLNNSNIQNRAKKVFEIEAVDESDLDEAEDIVAARDEFQAAIDIIRLVAKNIIIDNSNLKTKFVNAICNIEKADIIILERPDIARVATRVMEQFIPMIKTEINKNNYWWFYDMREYDKREDEINSDTAWALADATINPVILFQDKIKKDKVDTFENVTKIFSSITSPKYKIELPLAAASEKVSPLLVWEKPFNELKPFLESYGVISDAAEVDVQIQLLQSGFNASWYIDSLNIKRNCVVYVISADYCDVLGYANYCAETKTITLDRIIDNNKFNDYIDCPEKLLLILKK